jgi:DNA repair photolyase
MEKKTKMKNKKQVFGTNEWSVQNANFISGCYHDCKYCYSKEMAIRFKRKTSLNWHIEDINTKQLSIKIKKVNGLIMFPSSHDITPQNLPLSITFLQNLLESGNEILIVTKPHLLVIKEICDKFMAFKGKILFRFTIGSKSTDTLKFWEQNAPSFDERKESLVYAFNQGFSTSVSCEPMLDDSTEELVSILVPYITDSIWIGKANYLLRRLRMNGITDAETIKKANELIALQSDNNIKMLYENLKSNEKVKWKESIKKVVNLEISTIKGLDI